MAEAAENITTAAMPDSFGAYGRAQSLQQRIAGRANDNSRDAEIVTLHPAAPSTDSVPNKFGAYGTNSTVASTARAASNDNPVWLNELGLTTTDPTDFRKTWESDAQRFRRPTWRESYGGRLAIRTFSRGIMGAAFFSAGQMLASSALRNYNPAHTYGELVHKELVSFKRPLRSLILLGAKTMDATMGRAIEFAGTKITGSAEKGKNWVTFRNTRHYESYGADKAGNLIFGRSLGHEGWGITADFGAASLGDFTGREIAAMFDPNVKKEWLKDGKFNPGLWLKAIAKNAWTGLSRAMGEDYFAMLFGYPYIVRLSRNVIDRFSPGFKYDSDNALNGGSIKINDEGKIIGSYQLEGMADLGYRFSVYNMYTKAYRDFYDWTGRNLSAWWKGDRKARLPQLNTEHLGPVELIGRSLRYVGRVIVKMSLIMIPSTFFFYITRSPQTKDVGLAIHRDKGPVGVLDADKKIFYPLFADGTFKGRRGDIDYIPSGNQSVYDNNPGKGQMEYESSPFNRFIPFKGDSAKGFERRFDPYGGKRTNSYFFKNKNSSLQWYDRITNPIGRLCYNAGHGLTETLKPVARLFGVTSMGKVSRFSRAAAYASISYTPYFGMKTDVFTTAWDTPRMDMAIDQLFHGHFIAGISDILRVVRGQAFDDPAQEREAMEKMKTHRNQLWGETDENRIPDQTQVQLERRFARDDLRKKPLTQILERGPAAGVVPRDGDHRQQILKEFGGMTAQGQQVH